MEDTYDEILQAIAEHSTSRDPRRLRLASVTASVLESLGDRQQHSAAKVYACTLKTLEATLSNVDLDRQLDNQLTQCAILQLLSHTFPHVDSQTLKATVSVVRRILSASILSCQESQQLFDTKDGLGAVATTLKSICKCSCDFLRSVPPNTNGSEVSSLFRSTVLALVGHPRQKLQDAAHHNICELLVTADPKCHPSLRNDVTKYVASTIKTHRLGKDSIHPFDTQHQSFYVFLRTAVLHLDTVGIGTKLMEQATDGVSDLNALKVQATYLKTTKDGARARLELIVHQLSVILSILRMEDVPLNLQPSMGEFSARVLATAIQLRPGFIGADAAFADEQSQSCYVLHGSLIISASQKLIRYGHAETAGRLLPLALKTVLQLVSGTDRTDIPEIAAQLSPMIVELFRVEFAEFSQGDKAVFDRCIVQCVPVIEAVFGENNSQGLAAMSQVAVAFVSVLFDEYESLIAPIITKAINCRVRMPQDDRGDEEVVESLDHTVRSILNTSGLDRFWPYLVSEGPSASGTAGSMKWKILSIIHKQASTPQSKPTRLHFFFQNVLPLARQCDVLASKKTGMQNTYKARVDQLWSLFPMICANATDIDTGLPQVTPVLVRAVNDKRYPVIPRYICRGLDRLVERVETTLAASERDGKDRASLDTSFKKQCSVLLPSLFKCVGSLHTGSDSGASPEAIEEVSAAISSLAKVAPPETLASLYKRLLQKIVKATQSMGDDHRTAELLSLLCLSDALVSSEKLSADDLTLLYRCVKPLIGTDETHSRVQKRAYKVLLGLCNATNSPVQHPSQLKDVCAALSASQATLHVSARHMRLKCIESLLTSANANGSSREAITAQFLSEIILCLKDFNGRTRETAFGVLMTMVDVTDEVPQLVKAICASLGAETSHMRSAGLTALSRVVFDRASRDASVQALLPLLLDTVLLLFDDPAREVVKSVVGFVRVTVVALPPSELDPLLPGLVSSLLKYNRGKDRFRSKIKIILKKLVKMYGYERLLELAPDGDQRLLTHMRKLDERAARRRARNSEAIRTGGAETFDDLLDSDEEDSDDGRTLMTGFTGRTRASRVTSARSIRDQPSLAQRRSSKRSRSGTSVVGGSEKQSQIRVRNDAKGDMYDLTALTTAKTVRFEDTMDKDGDSDSDDIRFDSSGRLVIPDEGEETRTREKGGSGEGTKEKSAERNAGSYQSRFEAAKRNKASKGGKGRNDTRSLGAAYKSKKSGGDVKKKGQKYEPYAFVPLDGKRYTKHNRAKTVEEMSTVVSRQSKRRRRR